MLLNFCPSNFKVSPMHFQTPPPAMQQSGNCVPCNAGGRSEVTCQTVIALKLKYFLVLFYCFFTLALSFYFIFLCSCVLFRGMKTSKKFQYYKLILLRQITSATTSQHIICLYSCKPIKCSHPMCLMYINCGITLPLKVLYITLNEILLPLLDKMG